jgi:hypothetical protein
MTNQHFYWFAETSSGRCARTLLYDHAVTPEQIFATVLAVVLLVLPYLEDGRLYPTKMLCGLDVWSEWTPAERCVAGMCLAYLVRNRVIPLFKHITRSGKGRATYRTDPPPAPMARKITKIALPVPAPRVFQLPL